MGVYQNSRLVVSRVFADENGVAFIEPKIEFIESLNGDYKYMFKDGDRLDNLANEFYKHPQLKHIILRANPKYMSELDIKSGDIINIPNPERTDIYG